jgi:CheY-like chemotaxis protein
MSRSYHALIIDDDASNISVLDQLLALEGVSCTHIQDPRVLQNGLGNLPDADIIFLDLEMPKVNGYEAFALLRADPRYAEVPVVACTVHFNEIQTCRDLGFHSYIPKPLDIDHFPEYLKRIVSGEQVWARR